MRTAALSAAGAMLLVGALPCTMHTDESSPEFITDCPGLMFARMLFDLRRGGSLPEEAETEAATCEDHDELTVPPDIDVGRPVAPSGASSRGRMEHTHSGASPLK